MLPDALLGVPAHRAGLLVRDPALTVGVVQIIARPSGLEVELIARRGVPGPRAARHFLPPYDEGVDLRVGRLDDTGRARWEYGAVSSDGAMWRTRTRFPACYDEFRLVLAWPEIGFPEFTTVLPLPARDEVEQGCASVWEAPVFMAPVPVGVRHLPATDFLDEPPLETGRICARPRVLARDQDGVVVLSRLTDVDGVLSMVVQSHARIRLPVDTHGPWGATIAVLRDREAVHLDPYQGEAGDFFASSEFALLRPPGEVLDLVVTWPAVGLSGVRATIPLD
ncbi:hypothetical protein [Paractinoplanes lichenicola]|uniref:Uncharacterized protein n=1 Tax=Paractinoplanes lichenicola TaxID=2802976 RepID=A0ABS1VTW3_9ACTN|nr:hypothetical protein [Actinoplanes lichenicola]MBL7257918.1 hypothetical protein [Actinoplanes lichenicola]